MESGPTPFMEPLSLDDRSFEKISNFIFHQSGIQLNETKRSLVISRLQKLCRSSGLKNLNQYVEWVLSSPTAAKTSDLINAISTNHTFFYRESEHFQIFRQQVLPEWTQKQKLKKPKELRVWCSASSTGEEPYTLAMLMMEYLQNDYQDWNAGLLATDISETALKKARNAIYEKKNLSKLPPELREKYFQSLDKNLVKVKEKVQREIMFRRFNLMTKFPFKKPFHVIFCRNVMIYFDRETRIQVGKKITDFLYPGGCNISPLPFTEGFNEKNSHINCG